MAKPRKHPIAPLGSKNTNKAPKIKSHAKKKPPQSDSNEPQKSKKSQRSIVGFVTAAASLVAVIGWTLFRGAQQRSKDKKLLRSMSRKPLFITEHAACRMDCRFVSRPQVDAALQHGRINNRKSERTLQPCPKIVVDADVPYDGSDRCDSTKPIQAVFSACRNETRLVTVIDTATNWPCGPC